MKFLAKTALAAGGSLLGLLVLELCLRAVHLSYAQIYTYDDDLATALRPGARGWLDMDGVPVYVRINSDGLRDREHDRKKADNAVRIAVLGDSFTEATQVPMEDAFWAVMERGLGRCPRLNGKIPEAINFGVSNYGTAQELITLTKRVWAYSPDVVVLAFFAGNDFLNNSKRLEFDTMRPFYELHAGRLVLDDSFRHEARYQKRKAWSRRLLRSVSDYSYAAQILIKRFYPRLHVSAAASKEPVAKSHWSLDEAVYREPATAERRRVWDVTEEMIREMYRQAAAHGADFILVIVGEGIQEHPNPRIREEFMREAGIRSLDYPDWRLRRLGSKEGFPVLDLPPFFRAYAETHQTSLHSSGDIGHWNSLGHRLAGERLAGIICGRPRPGW